MTKEKFLLVFIKCFMFTRDYNAVLQKYSITILWFLTILHVSRHNSTVNLGNLAITLCWYCWRTKKTAENLWLNPILFLCISYYFKCVFLHSLMYILGESRSLQVEGAVFERAAELLRRSPEFTVLASLRQEPANSGTILSFSHGYNR